ncbi:hypothetical protein COL01_11505 [Bacillus thuringiensis]|uniref:Uncharacterized protein n=1 Tax=Bacillus thuringiensis TaxID=1428 RepID=A0A9X6WSE3_BACTU|nr:hypothetical protein [Bacillus thuringiensis]PFJ42578.1 hypothetical protein COJ15_05970 [Bacillus thuringiensis]PFN60561.1 hypothetical protein COJ75_11075 [Bacillus thuringiensis]PFV34475.1 hypothetical protein COL01_11505 [Bacillus thuringiensis]
MKTRNHIALTCITHDPLGELLPIIRTLKDELKNLNYNQKYITISNVTPEEVVNELKLCNFNINIIEKLGVGHARRESLKFVHNYSHDYYHYCDFDRLLTWILEFPDELDNFIRNIVNVDYLIIGRTQDAFSTHPEEWKVTESITNKIMSLHLGKAVDITAGSCSLSKRSIEYIIKYSSAKMTDAEWPMIIKTFTDYDIDYIEVEGLKYIQEFNKSNVPDYSVDSWLIRLKLSYIISQSIADVVEKSLKIKK